MYFKRGQKFQNISKLLTKVGFLVANISLLLVNPSLKSKHSNSRTLNISKWPNKLLMSKKVLDTWERNAKGFETLKKVSIKEPLFWICLNVPPITSANVGAFQTVKTYIQAIRRSFRFKKLEKHLIIQVFL